MVREGRYQLLGTRSPIRDLECCVVREATANKWHMAHLVYELLDRLPYRIVETCIRAVAICKAE